MDLPSMLASGILALASAPEAEEAIDYAALAPFLVFTALAMGATVGSFLNVCIYRVPRELSVNNPRRSFCPSCNYAIPWYNNIPLVSWLLLRGRCANCKGRISIRYWLVELLTAAVFLVVWQWCGGLDGWQMALVYWVFMALLITATFIDFEHFIIPDGITVGGTIAGLVGALAVPAIMGTDNHLAGLGLSALGAATGFGLLWLVVVLGKLAFGKKTQSFSEAAAWKITQEGNDENPTLTVHGKPYPWEELFFCGTEFVRLECQEVSLNGARTEKVPVEVHMEHILIGASKTELGELKAIGGLASRMVYSREAMGFGDVKFIAMIGAFLGWQAVLFTIFLASVVGTLVALPLRLVGKQEWSSRIPFGPYLALGAVVWLFFGRDLIAWYMDLLHPER